MSLNIYLEDDGYDVFEANITSNLAQMAERAGVYNALWNPTAAERTAAINLSGKLSAGLLRIVCQKSQLEQLNPTNRWGDYAGLRQVVLDYLTAVHEHPYATVRVSS